MSTNERDSAFWHGKRVIVTGGSGFLGQVVVRKLQERGAEEIIVPRSADYDLRDINAIRRLLEHKPGETPADMVIHLAANVGGIGANRNHPAEFFYDNLMMGTQLIHVSWCAGVD